MGVCVCGGGGLGLCKRNPFADLSPTQVTYILQGLGILRRVSKCKIDGINYFFSFSIFFPLQTLSAIDKHLYKFVHEFFGKAFLSSKEKKYKVSGELE